MANIGYAGVAAALNRAYAWPGKTRAVTRQQVEAWHKRRTLNRAGQVPPSQRGRRAVFRIADWIEWARPGVPGPQRSGWIVPVPGGMAHDGATWDPEKFDPRAHARPRVLSAAGHWVLKGGKQDPGRAS